MSVARTFRACPWHNHTPGHVCTAYLDVHRRTFTPPGAKLQDVDHRVLHSRLTGGVAKDFPYGLVPVAFRGRGRVPMHPDMDKVHAKHKERTAREREAWRATRRANRVSVQKRWEPAVDVRRAPDLRY